MERSMESTVELITPKEGYIGLGREEMRNLALDKASDLER